MRAPLGPYPGLAPSRQPWLARVKDPVWLPHYCDEAANAFSFAHLPRAERQRLVFLDPRYVRSELSPLLPITDLEASTGADAAQPVHFIFHVAFCCSTLLTRALDIPGVAMGLKEPSILLFLKSDSPRANLELALDLLSRRLNGETQIVKPSNTVNDLLGLILQLRPNARAIFMHTDLPRFVGAIARRGDNGRKFAQAAIKRFPPLRSLAPLSLPDGDLRYAAVLWVAQMHLFRAALERFGVRRIRTLSAEAFLAAPTETVFNGAQFFGLDVSKPHAEAIANGPTFYLHSKEYVAFDAAAYRDQDAAARQRYANEIAAVIGWAQEWDQSPVTLGDTLLTDRAT